jgi:hypothetical protein
MDRELEMFLRLGVRALSKLPGGLLQASKGHPAPFNGKAQMHIAAERPLVANLAQKIAHTRMVFEIPGRQVRW